MNWGREKVKALQQHNHFSNESIQYESKVTLILMSMQALFCLKKYINDISIPHKISL